MRDEEELLVEQRKVLEDEVWKMFQQHMESWEPTEKNIDSVAGQASQNDPKQQNKGKELGTRLGNTSRLCQGSQVVER